MVLEFYYHFVCAKITSTFNVGWQTPMCIITVFPRWFPFTWFLNSHSCPCLHQLRMSKWCLSDAITGIKLSHCVVLFLTGWGDVTQSRSEQRNNSQTCHSWQQLKSRESCTGGPLSNLNIWQSQQGALSTYGTEFTEIFVNVVTRWQKINSLSHKRLIFYYN